MQYTPVLQCHCEHAKRFLQYGHMAWHWVYRASANPATDRPLTADTKAIQGV